MRLEASSFFFFPILVEKNISKELDASCNWKVNDLLNNVSSERGKCVIDKELQHTNDFVVCVPPFSVYFVT